MYTAPYGQANVRTTLNNPAYVGHTVDGRADQAELQTFDRKTGGVGELPPTAAASRPRFHWKDCLVGRTRTKPSWADLGGGERAKLGRRSKEKYRPPREAVYYLKGLLYCGNCDRPLTPNSMAMAHGRVQHKYVCRSYTYGLMNGTGSKCKRYVVHHEDAEALVLKKLARLGRQLEDATMEDRLALEREERLLGGECEALRREADDVLGDGLAAYVRELKDVFGFDQAQTDRLAGVVDHLVCGDVLTKDGPRASVRWEAKPVGLAITYAKVWDAIRGIEDEKVRRAEAKVKSLKAEHKRLTLEWAKASSMMQGVLKEELIRLEREVEEWEGRTLPLMKRVEQLDAQVLRKRERMAELVATWPDLELLQRGESLRKVFSRVVCYWKKAKWGKGFRYVIDEERVGWEYTGEVRTDGSDVWVATSYN